MLTVLLFGVLGIAVVYFLCRLMKIAKVGAAVFAVVFCLLFSALGFMVACWIGTATADYLSEVDWEADIIGGKEPMIFAETIGGFNYLLFVVRGIDGKPVMKKAFKTRSNIVASEGAAAHVRVFKLRYIGSRLWRLPARRLIRYEFSVPVGTKIE